MRIALINENSQRKKNELILKVLEKVATKYGHQVFNYGVSDDKTAEIDYVGVGILVGILLNSKAVDFVITGCASGEGAMISANAFPNVYCGYVQDAVDIELFLKVNAGNAISIPFGKYFGMGAELNLENIFEKLFCIEAASGYPVERREIQNKQRNELMNIKRITQINMNEILEEIDKDLLYNMIHNEYFEENFFSQCENDEIRDYLKNIIDAWENDWNQSKNEI